MSSDNSISDLARKLLADLFSNLRKNKGYWYEVQNNEYFSSYLATALAVRESDFQFVMKSAGFFKKYGDGFRFNVTGMKTWVLALDLPVQISTFGYQGKTNIPCIGLGRGDDLSDHPKNQGKAPRFPADIWKYSKLFRVFVNSFDSTSSEDAIRERSSDEEQKEKNKKMHHPDVSKLMMNRLKTTLLPVLLADGGYKLKPNLRSDFSLVSIATVSAEVEEIMRSIIKEVDLLKWQKMMKLCGDEEEAASEDIETAKNKYPTLSLLNVPLSSDFVQKQILRDIVRWNNDMNGTKTMSVVMMNSVEVSLVQIPKSGSANRAKRNEYQIAWLRQLLCALSGKNDTNDEET